MHSQWGYPHHKGSRNWFWGGAKKFSGLWPSKAQSTLSENNFFSSFFFSTDSLSFLPWYQLPLISPRGILVLNSSHEGELD